MKEYTGLPLSVFVFDGKYWAGRSNFHYSQDLKSLEDAIKWIEIWNEQAYELFDGSTFPMVCYISSIDHLEHAKRSVEVNYTKDQVVYIVGLPKLKKI